MRTVGALLFVASFAIAGEPLPDGAVARFGSAPFPVRDPDRPSAFSPDGRTVAAGGRVLNRTTGGIVSPPNLVVIGFAPTGDWVADRDGTVLVVDPATAMPKRTLAKPAEDATVRAVAFAADGRTAAVAWQEYGVAVYDLTAEPLLPQKMTDAAVWSVALSADGRRLAVGGDRTATLWDRTRSGAPITLTSPDRAENKIHTIQVAFAPDSRFLAVAARNSEGSLRVVDTDRGTDRVGFVPPVGAWWNVRFRRDGEEVIGFSSGCAVVRWSARTGQEVGRHEPPEPSGLPGDAMALSPDGRTAVAHTLDGYLRVWDVATRTVSPVCNRHPPLRALAFPSADTVLSLADDGTAFVWELRTGRLLRTHRLPNAERDYAVVLTADGAKLAVRDPDRSGIIVIETATGKELCRIATTHQPTAFAFRPDGTALIVSERDADDALYDTRTGAKLRPLGGRGHRHLAFAPDGRSYFAVRDGVSVREAATGRRRSALTVWAGVEDPTQETQVSGDGRTVVVTSDGNCTVYAVRDGTPVLVEHWTYSGPFDPPIAALAPDGRWLAVAAPWSPFAKASGTIRVRDASRVAYRPTLAGHTTKPRALAFTPDGRYLVSCGDDGTALVWDVARWRNDPLPSPPPDDRRLALLWDDLATSDVAAAWNAMTELSRYPARSVPFLAAKLRPIAAPDPAEIARHIAALDAKEYAARERASAALGRYAEQAELALVAALKAGPSAETAARIRRLLQKIADADADPQQLRWVRAVEVLERIGTPEAKALLAELAKGDSAARLTREARASLQRLSK